LVDEVVDAGGVWGAEHFDGCVWLLGGEL
jgi:hypothetical protein